MKLHSPTTPLNILLADDDTDDRFFFGKALDEIPFNTHLETVVNGEQLMNRLYENSGKLPDVLFLDLNMPRKNGSECLEEIKTCDKIDEFPIVIYSTSVNDFVADLLYQKGAHYYMKKDDIPTLIRDLRYVFSMFERKGNNRPSREDFIVDLSQV